MLEVNVTPLMGATILLLLLLCIWWLIVEWGFNKPNTSDRSSRSAKAAYQKHATASNSRRERASLNFEKRRPDIFPQDGQNNQQNNHRRRGKMPSSLTRATATPRRTARAQSNPNKNIASSGSIGVDDLKQLSSRSPISDTVAQDFATAKTTSSKTNSSSGGVSHATELTHKQPLPAGASNNTNANGGGSGFVQKNNPPDTSTNPMGNSTGHSTGNSIGRKSDKQRRAQATPGNNNTTDALATRSQTHTAQAEKSTKQKPAEQLTSQLKIGVKETNTRANQSARQSTSTSTSTIHPNNIENHNPNNSGATSKDGPGPEQQTAATPNESSHLHKNPALYSSALKTPATNATKQTAKSDSDQKTNSATRYQTAAKAKSPSVRDEASIQIPTPVSQETGKSTNQTTERSTSNASSAGKKQGNDRADKTAAQILSNLIQQKNTGKAAADSITKNTEQRSDLTSSSSPTVHSISVAATSRAKTQRSNSGLKNPTGNPVSSAKFRGHNNPRKQSPIEMAVAQKSTAPDALSSAARGTTTADAPSTEHAIRAKRTAAEILQQQGLTKPTTDTDTVLRSEDNRSPVTADSASTTTQTDETGMVDADASLRAQLACSERRIETLQSTLNNLQDNLPGMTVNRAASSLHQHNRPTLLSKVRVLDQPKA